MTKKKTPTPAVSSAATTADARTIEQRLDTIEAQQAVLLDAVQRGGRRTLRALQDVAELLRELASEGEREEADDDEGDEERDKRPRRRVNGGRHAAR